MNCTCRQIFNINYIVSWHHIYGSSLDCPNSRKWMFLSETQYHPIQFSQSTFVFHHGICTTIGKPVTMGMQNSLCGKIFIFNNSLVDMGCGHTHVSIGLLRWYYITICEYYRTMTHLKPSIPSIATSDRRYEHNWGVFQMQYIMASESNIPYYTSNRNIQLLDCEALHCLSRWRIICSFQSDNKTV